jgi:hypothetical protein
MNLPHSVEELINWMNFFNDKPKAFRKPESKNASTVFLQLKNHYLELFLNHAPNNPRQIKAGQNQLKMYLEEVEKIYGTGWKTVLDLY